MSQLDALSPGIIKYTTSIKDNKIHFTIDNQHFTLNFNSESEYDQLDQLLQLESMRKQLQSALTKLANSA